MYYIRKLTKTSTIDKIKSSHGISDIPADVLKEFNTQNNTLSFWKCNNLEEEKNDTLKAILFSLNKIDKYQFIIINEDLFEKYNLVIKDTKGKTAYTEYINQHVDLINLTYAKIGDLLKVIKQIINDQDYLPYLNKDEVKSFIKNACYEGKISFNDINQDLLNDIDKYKLR